MPFTFVHILLPATTDQPLATMMRFVCANGLLCVVTKILNGVGIMQRTMTPANLKMVHSTSRLWACWCPL